jgi:hypothetical protein
MTTSTWLGIFIIFCSICAFIYYWIQRSFTRNITIGIAAGILFGLVFIYLGTPSLQAFLQGI